VIDSKDVVPQSENDGDQGSDKSTVTDSIDQSFNIAFAEELGLMVKEFKQVNEPFFLDRFTPRHLFKWDLSMEAGDAFVGQWSFKDSVSTMNAFYNWLDCFGARRKSFKLLDKVNFQSDNFIVFLNDTSITFITSPIKLDKELWRRYFEGQNNVKEWDLVLYQAKRGKVNWMTYQETNRKDKFEFKPFEQTYENSK
jgi:hypothetical protein